MYQSNKELYEDVQYHFSNLSVKINHLKAKIAAETNVGEVIDTLYVMRECIKLLEESIKQCKDIQRLGEAYTCLKSLDVESTKISTEYCTATCDIKQNCGVPKRRANPEKFDALMKEIGVPSHLYEQEVVRLHWPGFQSYCQSLAAEGKNYPKNVEESTNEFVVSIRKKKDILESD